MNNYFLIIVVVLIVAYVDSKPTANTDNGIIGKTVQLSQCCPQDPFCCSGIRKMFLMKLSIKKLLS